MKLRLTSPVSISRFNHNKLVKIFTVEASDLNVNIFQQIYDDAADKGFAVINPNTDVTITLVFEKELFEGCGTEDCEVIGWDFTPSSEDVKRHPRLNGYVFRVFND
jgi:hypothetical protein